MGPSTSALSSVDTMVSYNKFCSSGLFYLKLMEHKDPCRRIKVDIKLGYCNPTRLKRDTRLSTVSILLEYLLFICSLGKSHSEKCIYFVYVTISITYTFI